MDNYSLNYDNAFLKSLSKTSLLRYYSNAYSECGQDGILSHIFSRLNMTEGFFVEFGAWDGVHLSNSRALLLKGWTGCLIECDPNKYELLRQNAPLDTICINEMVGTSNGDVSGKPLSTILSENFIKLDSIDFLSIDIDGGDLEIFEDLDFYPPVILVEGGFNYNPRVNSKVDLKYALKDNQHPLGAVFESAKVKGYTCVCFFQDSYLIRNDLMYLFSDLKDLDAQTLYRDAWNFASKKLKNYLLELRDKDDFLKSFEMDQLGFFNSDPTAI